MAQIQIALRAWATRHGEDIRAARFSGSFPLTPALSLGERVNPTQRGGQSRVFGSPLRDARCPLSPRERVRVRGNGAATIPRLGPFPRLRTTQVLGGSRRIPQTTMNQINKPVIEVEDFSKEYGEFNAVRHLSFAVQPGEIVGLVGANGAGKTTTLRGITGILRPSAGTVRIVGFDIEREPVSAKQQFAYVPDTIHPYDLLTVTEHLHFIALAYRVADAEAKYAALLEELELADKKHEIASSLSRGMLQKLSLACAFLREPRVIILDEPLTGLDPRGIRNIKQSIRRRASAGTAFLLSSHLLVLVEALCDQVLILHRGQKMAFGSLGEIRSLATLRGDASLEDVFFAVTEGSSEPAVVSAGT